MPAEAENLLEVIRLKILARELGVLAVSAGRGEVVLSVSESANIDPQRLLRLLTRAGGGIRVTPDHKIHAPAPVAGSSPAALFDCCHELLRQLGA